jgi:hypothetical protein
MAEAKCEKMKWWGKVTHYILIVLLVFCMAGSVSANELILCNNPSAPDVIITLAAKIQFDRVLNCISGEFVADLTPCAPTDGYGLSAPTGDARLVGVVDRWQDYTNRSGGVTQSIVNEHQIYFMAGFEGNSFEEWWEFSVNRLNGKAILKELKDSYGRPSDKTFTYSCSRAKQRF